MRLIKFALVLVACPALALAQEDAPARRITVIPPEPVAPPLAPKKPAPVFARPRPQTLALTDDTLTARSASAVDRASQCRAACAQTRYICAVDDSGAGGECDTHWMQCNVGCSGSGYTISSSAYVPLGR